MLEKSNVMLLGFTVPDTIAKQLFAVDAGPAVQTHKFAWSLTRALQSSFNKVVLASSCPIQNYPLGRQVIFRNGVFKEQGIDGVLLGFINLLVLKHLTRFIACLFVLPKLIKRHRIDSIFVHGTHTPFLIFGLIARLFGKEMIVVLTDPPGVVLPTDSFIARLLKRVDVSLVSLILSYANAVITLAPELVQRFVVKKPSLVFPGILDSVFVKMVHSQKKQESQDQPFTVLYAGSLNKAYGVDLLIEAIENMPQTQSIQLKLFGRGDQEEKIKQLAKQDSRFIYGGFVGNELLIPELLKASLLVNPRPTHEAFAVMSFPSKLIEYLAIGRPVLTTRIASIPEPYKPHFFFIEEETSEGIKNAILEIINMDNGIRMKKALSGQNFINKEASEYVVGQKIVELLHQLK